MGAFMNPERTIKAKDIIKDIRGGMDIATLMAKYRLTIKALRSAFRQLVEVSAVSPEELNELHTLQDGSVKGVRRSLRCSLKFPIKIFDGGDPFKGGVVKNISRNGLCIQGMDAALGDVKTFVIRVGPFGASSAVVFEAKCRWVKKDPNSGKTTLAGFEITDISALDSGTFDRIISS